ncbi:MAG: hypothetical protein OXG49_03430 [Chloroflexi bacterium]|nr:hypothetical protein [Chloroflexota bacterium]
MRKIIGSHRDHRHFLVTISLLIVVMTFPTIAYVFNTEVFWVPTGNHPDTWMKFWDAWFGKMIFSGRADYYYTDQFYHPRGISLLYHNFSIPHMLVFGGLQALMPASNAYSLAFLLFVASVACSAYLYMLYLFKDKWIALLGAVVIGMSPYVVGYPEHPELRFMTPLLLAVYFFHRGIAERRCKLAVIAAILTGATAYTSMHSFVCLVITLTMYTLYFACSRWKERAFWVFLGLFAVTAAIASSPRLYPMLQDSQSLAEAINSRSGQEVGNDLLEYFVNARHPIVKSIFQQPFTWGLKSIDIRYSSYIGFTALALVGFGLLRKPYRQKMIPWLLLAFPFLVLRLGSTLTIDGVPYPTIVLPKHFLDDLIPEVTAGFTLTSCFYAGALIPLAALVCYGYKALDNAIPNNRRPIVALILVGILSFEYYQPVRPGFVTEQELAFLNWLETEPADARLINLPASGQSNRALYSFHQTRNGFPHAAGLVAREKRDVFDYWDQNFLLHSWRHYVAVTCGWRTKEEYISALDQLVADGFTHVILHRTLSRSGSLAASFAAAQPSYADDYVWIFRLEDLRAPCEKDFVAAIVAASPYSDAYLSPSVIYRRHGVVLSFHQTQPVHPEFLHYFSHNSFDQKSAVHISYGQQGALVLQSSDDSFTNLDIISGLNSGLWLINGKPDADLTQIPAYEGWLKKYFKFCHRYMDRDEASIDLYLKSNIPCEAVSDQSKFEVRFDGGARLHNLSYDLFSDRIIFYLSWTNGPENRYSFSLQFFDERGEKAHQYDSVILREPVSAYSVDISGLRSGSYKTKLIVYNYETGASVSGTVIETRQRFERELEIATFERS